MQSRLARQATLRQFRCLVAVAQERGLGRAAERLHLSQPAVSKTLAALERLAGARLFERGRSGARLTRDGEALLPHALAMLEALDDAGRAFSRGRSPRAERLAVGALPTVAADAIPAVLQAFRRRRPKAHVILRADANAPLMDSLRDGSLDLVLGRLSDPERMSGLAFELLYLEPLAAAVRPAHPLLRAGTPTLAAALDYPIIVSTAGTTPRHATEGQFAAHGLRMPGNALETLSVSTARLVTQASDSVWFTPAGAVQADVAAGSLAQLDLTLDGTEEAIGLVTRTGAAPSPVAAEFLDVVRQWAAARAATPHA